ncbi:MAG TPA: 5'-3' exonuclease H3TH domain-containing protein [Xanthobacteraceae bacterium]|nr:5'-3' exonuclease H3TH domain-containing protein [Xanthobacteraceae bacterium]
MARQGASHEPPLLVIDGDSFAHRAYHALPKTIRMKGGKPAGAVVGFANTLLRLHAAAQPRAVVVGWDTLDVATYRHDALPAYQSGRAFDRALLDQLDILPALVSSFGFVSAKAPGYEADDFLAAAVRREERRDGLCVVASGDRDTFQLVSERTIVMFPVRGGDFDLITPAEVRKRYGVDPAQVPDFIALRGDPSDKIPGARGVGASGAATLLRSYGSLEAALAAGRFPDQARDLRLYKAIATMDADAPLPPLRNRKPTWARAAALLRDWQLDKLADRVAQLADAGKKA